MRVPVADRAVVTIPLVEAPAEVEEAHLPVRDRALRKHVARGRQQTVAQLGHVLRLHVVVQAFWLAVVEE